MKKLQTLTLLAALAIGSMTLLNSCAKDLCKDIVCENGGNCVEGDCDCLAGYEGTSCETEMRTKFIGTYSVTDACVASGYNVQIQTSSAGVTNIVITNFGSYLCSGEAPNVVAIVNGRDLTIEEQTFCPNDAFTIKGTGSINESGTTITLNYDGTKPPSEGGGTYNCSVTMNKQ